MTLVGWVLGIIAAITPVDPKTLPAWDAPPAKSPAKDARAIEIFAVDMDGDRLLSMLARDAFIARPANTKVTAHITAPDKAAAFALVASKLGVDVKPPKLSGKGATVDFEFAQAPVVDLLHILADTGNVNVVAPGDLGTLDVRVKRKPWDAMMTAIFTITGRTTKRVGNTFYALPAGTKLPELPKVKSKVVVELDLHDATIAHALAALREV